MRKTKKILVLAVCILVFTAFSFALDDVEGYWISIDDKTGDKTAGWTIYQKNGVLFGEILSAKDVLPGAKADKVKDSYKDFPIAGKVNQMTVTNTPWIWGLTKDKSGSWSGGNIIDPKDGKMYKCKITFRPKDGKKYLQDTLEMRGEIGLGIGRSQFWVRSTKEEAAALR